MTGSSLFHANNHAGTAIPFSGTDKRSMIALTLPKSKIHTGSLILVNHRYEYREPSDRVLAPVCEGVPEILLERQAVALLGNLMEHIHGWRSIVPVSGWRSLVEQQQIWDDSMEENGKDFTETYVALPGHSEHQTGLAIDLGLKQASIDFIRPEFPYSGICGTFRQKAADFGFVERYPRGKEDVTGIGHEPWHFRYVGVPHASIMTNLGLTLEEYTDFLRQFPYGERPYRYCKNNLTVTVSYAAADGDTTRLELDGASPYSISGNNVDGFIITEWRDIYGRESSLRRA